MPARNGKTFIFYIEIIYYDFLIWSVWRIDTGIPYLEIGEESAYWM